MVLLTLFQFQKNKNGRVFMAINILLADDHRMVREGLRHLLETDREIKVVGEAGDGYECLNLANKTKPNLVLLDINVPNLDGLQVLNIMKQQKMLCKVIILTIHKEVDYLIKALDQGCDGYVLKDSDFETLRKAIFTVYSGDTYVEPTMMPLLNATLAERDVMYEKLSDLTKREIEVLKMIAAGSFNKEIASTLNISERTVKNHVSNIFKKIGVSDRTQAAVFAIKNNIITIK
jgi:DNA-binding NarL/FixJ family response regulator